MNKKTKAALAGLAFFAGCEIGIAIQLMKMIHKFTVRESAMTGSVPEDTAEKTADHGGRDQGTRPWQNKRAERKNKWIC